MNAVIYCRVSSKEQVEGTSLESQELACRDYAKRHNLEISKVFIEQGESAKFADRTQLLELLAYCKDKTRNIEVLLVWKLDRFARNVEDHYTIKAALKRVGVRIASVTEPIQPDPNGMLMETILAGFAQFDNDVRALRTVQGMQQRLREGIWPWKPPLGYLPPKMGKKTQPDLPDPHSFEAFKRAWELFATGGYTKADILRLLRTWGVTSSDGRPLSAQTLDHTFRNPYYAGVLRDPFSGDEHRGRHTPMVTVADFRRVQEVIRGRSRSLPHHKLTEAFPLRGHVRCPSCQSVMTAAFSQGKYRRYAYYKCFRAACPTKTKSYRADLVHDEFAQFMTESTLPHYAAEVIVTEIICAHWETTEQRRHVAERRREQLEDVNKRLQELVAMRAARLIGDDEFSGQRTKLRKERSQLEARNANQEDTGLTDAEVRELQTILTDMDAAWRATPLELKRSFAALVLPCGYVFEQIDAAVKGLLFKTVAASEGSVAAPSDMDQTPEFAELPRGAGAEGHTIRTPTFPHHMRLTEPLSGGESQLVALIRENINPIMQDIRKLLALVKTAKTLKKTLV